jgi:hypothetical protein
MTDNDVTHASEQVSESNPSIENLERLVGSWQVEITMPSDPPLIVRGLTVYKWLEEGRFLLMRSNVEHADFPIAAAVVGGDDSNGSYSMLYSDSRGVTRIYAMSLSGEVWELWRNAPGFSQRFTGEFSEDGNTITGRWEASADGENWKLDFDLTYTKANPA